MTTLKKEKSFRMHERTTKCICHNGFSGYSCILAHSNFRIDGQKTAPQALTAHTLGSSAAGYDTKNKKYG